MGFKDYVTDKKARFDAYVQKRHEQKQYRDELKDSKAKLALLQEAKQAREELKEKKLYDQARQDVKNLKEYKQKQRRESSVFHKIGSGLESGVIGFRQGVDDIQAANERMFGKQTGNEFDFMGGDILGLGSPKPKPKRRKKAKSKRKKGKSITITYS